MNIPYITAFFEWFIKPVNNRGSLYRRALGWSLVVLIILLLPYIFSTFIDYITHTKDESVDGFFGSFKNRVLLGINNGSFLFISIGLSSASYIDYVFQKGLNANESMIHVTFFALLIVILGMFTCIDLMNVIGENKVFKMEIDNVQDIVFYHFVFSFVYSVAVKALIFNYREANYVFSK